MIERIVIENFKSLRKVDLKLGWLNLFIGTNASGKSNFFDALRFLQRLSGGFSPKEAMNGTAKTRAGGDWPGIRGGFQNVSFRPRSVGTAEEQREDLRRFRKPLKSNGAAPGFLDRGGDIAFHVDLTFPSYPPLHYKYAFTVEGGTAHETLTESNRKVFNYDGQDAFFHLTTGELVQCGSSPFSGSQIYLAYQQGLAGIQKPIVERWWQALNCTQFLSPDPRILRDYGSATPVKRLGEHGEDFASIVKAVCEDPPAHSAYVSWLKELRPAEVDDVATKPGALGEPMFLLRENGQEYLAPVLSEGTLRFAAITVAFFQPELPPLIAIEEVENGIHPNRARLLVELLRSQATQGKVQVMATTHSPLVLAWLKAEDYATTFHCKRDPGTGESVIRPLKEIPHFMDILKKEPIGDLLAEGWLEAEL